jgi:hypothetical protein
VAGGRFPAIPGPTVLLKGVDTSLGGGGGAAISQVLGTALLRVGIGREGRMESSGSFLAGCCGKWKKRNVHLHEDTNGERRGRFEDIVIFGSRVLLFHRADLLPGGEFRCRGRLGDTGEAE